jgi:ASCH domain
MRALTIKQPWAWAIAEGFKPVENRTWRTTYRGGPLLIHAGKTFDQYASIVWHSREAARRLDGLGGRNNFWDANAYIPSKVVSAPHGTLALGAVIAIAEITGCHLANEAGTCCGPWAEPNACHWQLSHVHALPTPVPCNGRLGLWNPSDDLVKAVITQVKAAR